MSARFLFSKVVLLFFVCTSVHGGLVWDGPPITFTQPGTDPTQANNQDRLTPNVWLTRANSGGLFNAVSETSAGLPSPSDTEWAFGTADQFKSLTFTNWLQWLNGQSPTNLVGKQFVAHLISEDIYVSMKMTFWASKGAGGFAYIRSTPPVLPTIWDATATNGLVQFNYSTTTNFNYVVDGSPDLVNWAAEVTNTASSTVGNFQESSSTGMKFYRVRQILP